MKFDENRVLDSDGILDLKTIPGSMVVVGAGVIGIEYASMFAARGTKVTVVEKRDKMLEFCDPEIIGIYSISEVSYVGATEVDLTTGQT